MTNVAVHSNGFPKDDPRGKLFPDLGSSPWIAHELGYTKYENLEPCEICGCKIRTVYPNNKKRRLENKCWDCKKEEPKRNHDTTAANKAKDRARRRNAVPNNLTDADLLRIKEFYALRNKITEETGIEHHVDHIIPISKGGLHHPNNLRVITATENMKKGDKMIDLIINH